MANHGYRGSLLGRTINPLIDLPTFMNNIIKDGYGLLERVLRWTGKPNTYVITYSKVKARFPIPVDLISAGLDVNPPLLVRSSRVSADV